MAVKLISITPKAEELISFCARVSNPANQENYDTAPKLLAYLIKHKHWSPFEMAHAVVEIKTTRAIAAQILRHRSFCFQEFSQRYAEAVNYIPCEARSQDPKNRQNSVDNFSKEDKEWFDSAQAIIWNNAKLFYDEALNKGIAKECARMLLPLNTETTIYMSGTIRSFLHYVDLREKNGTQKEHQDHALDIKAILVKELPNTAKAMGWA